MPNGLLKYSVRCPNCKELRLVRSDVLSRLTKLDKPLICKACHNRSRFKTRNHPKKGTGVKNNPELFYTRISYYKAKRRCKMGKKHHACYDKIQFKFQSLDELISCIGLRPKNMTLDRIDPFGNYEPGNVRWATAAQQTENRLPRGFWKS